jgi:tetratricopeptide (TPR) repeat protein
VPVIRILTMAVVVAIGVAPARAETAGELVRQAEAQWAQLDFDRVIDRAEAALATVTATVHDRIEALRLKGSSLVVLDRVDEAAAAFEKIFALDPSYQLPPKTSPRILAVFAPARARWQVATEQRLAIELGPALAAHALGVVLPPSPRGGRALEIAVELADPKAIARAIALSYRRAGSAYYTTTTVAARPGKIAITLPPDTTASEVDYTLELFVRSTHASGVTLRRAGDADQPLRLAVAAGRVPVARPLTRRWWFWAGVGAIAVGGAILVDRARDVGPQHAVLSPP